MTEKRKYKGGTPWDNCNAGKHGLYSIPVLDAGALTFAQKALPHATIRHLRRLFPENNLILD